MRFVVRIIYDGGVRYVGRTKEVDLIKDAFRYRSRVWAALSADSHRRQAVDAEVVEVME